MLKLSEAEGTIERETAHVLHGRPVCVRLTQGGVRVWLKGKREFYTVPYDVLFNDGQRGSVKIPARKIADAKLGKIIAKREAGVIGCVQHDCAKCKAREFAALQEPSQ